MKKFCDLKVGDRLECYDDEANEFFSEKILILVEFSSGYLEIITDLLRFSLSTKDLETDFLRIDYLNIATSMDRLLLETQQC